MSGLVLRDVEFQGTLTDVIVAGGRVAELGSSVSAPPAAETIDAAGGALLPGLWDHHIHLLALAATTASVAVGPPQVPNAAAFAAALRRAAEARPPGSWIRAIGHHESAGGDPDRDDLDGIIAGHPVRIQHRSGAMWILNSAAIERAGIGADAPAGVERSPDGRPTGRVFGLDQWLRERLPVAPPPDLATVGRLLASRGVVGVTDATPYSRVEDLSTLAAAVQDGSLAQHLVATGGPTLNTARFPDGVQRGPVKIVLADHGFPELTQIATWISQAHDAARNVAIHCVTRTALVLALVAWEDAGIRAGDRVEHGAVIPPELRSMLADGSLTVVTQPSFTAERGDEYLANVDADDLPHLYPCGSLIAAGVPVGGSTDVPFGDADPWRAIAAAVDRRTRSGRDIGRDERITASRAIDLFLSAPDDPGGPPRRTEVESPADLCVLDRPLQDALADPAAVGVSTTVIGGDVVHHDPA